MKIKKLLLLIFSIILLTGCSSTINIELSDSTIKEEILITEKNNILYPNSNNVLDEEIAYRLKNFEWEYEHYNIEKKEIDSNTTGKYYTYETSINSWNQFSILRKCYDKVRIYSSKTKIKIETSEKYRCGYLYGANDVIVNIKSKYLAKENNADSFNKKDKTYTWKINEKNYENKPIIIEFEKEKENNNLIINEEDKTTTKIIKYVLIIVCIISIIGGIYIYIKVINSNK